MLGLDSYGNAADEMCSLLDRCYGPADYAGCRPILEGRLDAADSSLRHDWLDTFTNFDCLDSCSAGRHCLNIAPLCVSSGSCLHRQDCCGFLDGNAACLDNTCCRTRGSTCSTETDCCPGSDGCQNGICGGVACLDAGTRCEASNECCTRICKRGECSETICEDDKAACDVDQDCCNKHCDPGTKVCTTPPVCAPVDGVCAAETDCCDGNPCVLKSGTLAGTCQKSTCYRLDIDCSDDTACCSGHCDPVKSLCAPACVAETGGCSDDADCCAGACNAGVCAGTCSTTYCTKSADCCSKSCIDSVCAAKCNTPTVHPTCALGGPLAGDPGASACVSTICTADPFCCCGAWDDACVIAAVAHKNLCTDVCN